MDQFTDSVILGMLNSLDPTPATPTKEDLFISFLLCKNLDDLCETGIAILNDMIKRKISLKGLPGIADIDRCKFILRRFYTNNMFVDDEEMGSLPNWGVISSFDQVKTKAAFKIYRAIKNNLSSGRGESMQEAIRKRDTGYILKHFDEMFANIPTEFKENLVKFKNFIASTDVPKEHKEYVYIFFESLLELLFLEPQTMEQLKSL